MTLENFIMVPDAHEKYFLLQARCKLCSLKASWLIAIRYSASDFYSSLAFNVFHLLLPQIWGCRTGN